MTMTVRCSHCDQVMAIAPRKPGSRVTCPACGRSVTVHSAEAGTAAAPVPPNAPVAGGGGPVVGTVAGQAGRRRPTPELAGQAAASPPRSVAPAALPPSELPAPIGQERAELSLQTVHDAVRAGRAHWIALPPSVLILALVFALASLALAFFAGYLFGTHGTG
ncbi:MAG: hypothetical protein HY000_27650 [Planctomycetes bacterium]|nr:hypothetical protein [Planctomycetota bacterium]